MHPRILMVCHANVTRSVAAALLLRRALPTLDVRSAGTHATEGQPASSLTADALATVLTDADLRLHGAHLVSVDDLEWADLIVTMEASQVRYLRARHSATAWKAATLALLARSLPAGAEPIDVRVRAMGLELVAPDDHDDVIDPAGGDAAAYESTMAVLAVRCDELARRLGG